MCIYIYILYYMYYMNLTIIYNAFHDGIWSNVYLCQSVIMRSDLADCLLGIVGSCTVVVTWHSVKFAWCQVRVMSNMANKCRQQSTTLQAFPSHFVAPFCDLETGQLARWASILSVAKEHAKAAPKSQCCREGPNEGRRLGHSLGPKSARTSAKSHVTG